MLRILVVDDRVDYREVLVRLLENQPDMGVLAQAGSLSEAREKKLEGIDVALLDRGLPDGDGLELVGELRAMNPGATVFVISSTDEMTHPRDAIEAGADGVIDKLDPPERVFATIRERGGGQGADEHYSLNLPEVGKFCERHLQDAAQKQPRPRQNSEVHPGRTTGLTTTCSGVEQLYEFLHAVCAKAQRETAPYEAQFSIASFA